MPRPRPHAARPGAMSQALASDRLGVPSVLAFILASIAPMTVAAGVIPTAYAVTGLTGIPVAFLAVAVILALFCAGYVAMSRRIRHAGAFYGFVAAGLGKVPAVAAALMALLAYESSRWPPTGRSAPRSRPRPPPTCTCTGPGGRGRCSSGRWSPGSAWPGWRSPAGCWPC